MAAKAKGASRSRWRREADRVILGVLRDMPATATAKEKRAACNAVFPFGQKRYHPYRQWLASLRTLIPDDVPKKARTKDYGLPVPKPTGHLQLDALLAGYRDEPTDDGRHLIIADWLEEHSHGLAGDVRRAQPLTEDVASRLWPKSKVVHGDNPHGGIRWICDSRGGKVMPLRQLEDMVHGKTLLVVPEIQDAINVERCRVVLKWFA